MLSRSLICKKCGDQYDYPSYNHWMPLFDYEESLSSEDHCYSCLEYIKAESQDIRKMYLEGITAKPYRILTIDDAVEVVYRYGINVFNVRHGNRPEVVIINYHRQDRRRMRKVMPILKKHGMFFIDWNAKSVSHKCLKNNIRKTQNVDLTCDIHIPSCRCSRNEEKRVFHIDIGNLESPSPDEYVKRVKESFTKKN